MVKARGTITLARVDDGKDAAIQSDTAPSDKTKLWYDTVNNVFKSWDGSTWKVVNEVQVGGRNLIPNSNFLTGKVYPMVSAGATIGVTSADSISKGYKCLVLNQTGSGGVNMRTYVGLGAFSHSVGVQYTVSFMAKSQSENATLQVNVAGGSNPKNFSINATEWTKCVHTYTANNSGSLTFWLVDSGIAYITNIKLELGNKATDWTPAPEDVDSSINEAKDAAGNAQDSANTAISSVNDIRTSFGEYKDEVRAEFSSTVEYVDGKTEVVDNWIRQGTDGVNPYLELGGTGNNLKARLTNSRLEFYEGDKELAYFGNNKAYMPDADIDRANIERIQIGSYAWINNSDGHLTLVYVG